VDRTLPFAAVGVVVIALVLWSRDQLFGPASPLEAARQYVTQDLSPSDARSFTVLGTRPWSNREIVFYHVHQTAYRPPGDPWGNGDEYGWLWVVHSYVLGWQALGGSVLDAGVTPPHQAPVLVEAGHGSGSTGTYAYVFGHVLTRTVRTVQVAFSTGQTITTIPSKTIFMALSSSAANACQVRVQGVNGRLITEINLVADGLIPAAPSYCGETHGA